MGLFDAIRERFDGRGSSAGDDGGGRPADERAPDERDSSDVLVAHADRWEEAERGMGNYVVYPPPDGPSSVRRCHTLSEVRRRLDQWYGEDALDGDERTG